MILCKTFTKRNCKKRIVVTQQDNITTIKCLDYNKDPSKIEGYKKENSYDYRRSYET